MFGVHQVKTSAEPAKLVLLPTENWLIFGQEDKNETSRSELFFPIFCYRGELWCRPLLSISVQENQQKLGEAKKHNNSFKKERIFQWRGYSQVDNV